MKVATRFSGRDREKKEEKKEDSDIVVINQPSNIMIELKNNLS